MAWGDSNIFYWQDGDEWIAEWADRALNDDDRELSDTIKLIGRGPTKGIARSRVMDAYNSWIEERQ